MNIIDILLISISLSMDAFAVSLCKGIEINKLTIKNIIPISLSFGFFQFLMPLIGFLLGETFSIYINELDHWISFIILLLIGCNMLKEDNKSYNINIKTLILLSIATSIDALAIGITFAFLNVKIIISSVIIGITTFIISSIGVIISYSFKEKLKIKANLIGGFSLIIISLKILLEGII